MGAVEVARAGHESFEHARLFLYESYPGAPDLRARYRALYAGADTLVAPQGTTALLREMVDTHDSVVSWEVADRMRGE